MPHMNLQSDAGKSVPHPPPNRVPPSPRCQVRASKIQVRRAGGSKPASVYETREIKLRRRLRFNLRQAGKHEESGGQDRNRLSDMCAS